MESQWDQVYAGDVPPDFDQMRKREDRKERIKPYWDLLVTDKEPKAKNKDTLVRLMHDLKEEGNTLFKEAHYDIAWMHYRNAIFVVKILETRFLHSVEKEFTSSLFSNRAFCCLKKNMYKEAVQDCESAIGLYPKNIKAYYRQAQAHKHMKKYGEAFRAANKGDAIQSSSALKELIEELEPLVKLEQRVVGGGPVEVSAKSPASIVQANTPQPDTDWLSGTNISVTEKVTLGLKSKMPSKKNKKKNKTLSASPKTYADLYKDEDDDDDDDDDDDEDSDEITSSLGVEDDKEFANQYRGIQKNNTSGVLNGRSNMMGSLDIRAPNDLGEDSAWSFPHDADSDDVPIKRGASGGMGLDTFSAPGLPISDMLSSESTSLSNTSSGRSSRASQSPSKSLAVGPPSRQSSKAASPAPEPIPQITFPLIEEYDFKLACRHCFQKIGEGVKGSQYLNAAHHCLHDILIVKKKTTMNVNWVKIRSRGVAQGHYGQYKVCSEFSQSKACRVPEDKCSFPHHQAELKLWSLDRDKKFSIDDFISKCASYKIYSSSDLEMKSKTNQYIPGLNFADEKPRKALLDTPAPVSKPATHPGPVSRPNKQSGPVSQQKQQNNAIVSQTKQQLPQMIEPPQNNYEVSQQYAGNNSYRPPPNSGYRPYPGTMDLYDYGNDTSAGQYFNFGFTPPPFSGHMPRGPPQWTRQAPQVIQEQPMVPDLSSHAAKLENPLSKTHDSMIVCQHCFRPTGYPGMYDFKPITHKCEENILAMRPRDGASPWLRVRERKSHREFPGSYIMCRSVTTNNPKECKYGIEVCSFAHNEAERYFWTLEKDGKFNITEFLIQNRKYSAGKGFSLREILNKHGGYFEFICRSCYYGKPAKISKEGSNSTCSGEPPHSWKDFCILAHIGPKGYVTLINTRGFMHKTAFFKICRWYQFCRNKVNAECRFSHSMVERDVWMLERDCGISRIDVVRESKQLQNIALPVASGNEAIPAIQSNIGITITDTKMVESIPQATDDDVQTADGLCPYTVLEVCETCWKKGQKTQQEPGKDRCQKSHANWGRNIVYLLTPSNKELRPLPRKIPKMFNFIVCKFVREGRKCGFTGAGLCQFAHSTEELEAWKYMCINKIDTPQQLSEHSRSAQKIRAESSKTKISGQSVVSVSQTLAQRAATFPVASVHTYYCQYCGISCNSQKQWDDHCASEKHNFNMNSDKEHQWNYRQPPWAAGRTYELCAKHIDGESCQFSHVPEMYNICRYAHSQEELDEWRERYEWRQMKREMARQEKVFSYMDQLLEKYESSENSTNVITESLDGVEVKTVGELNIYREEKYTSYIWRFEVKSRKLLQRVALLYNRDRLHFGLYTGGEKTSQIAQGEMFASDVDHTGVPCYHVRVKFTGGMFGSFQQWVLFDFGGEPVLCRKMSVEVGDQQSHEKVRSLRDQLTFDRWNSLNRQIVRQDAADMLETSLTSKYKEPTSASAVITQTTVTMKLNRHNYVSKMHKLLELEEMTRHQIIASFNLVANIECLDVIKETTYVFAKPGELFAKVPLQENLTEDTDAGKLILSSVRKVLLAPDSDKGTVVYEAFIVREENFNYDGRCRDFIYLCLSPECVQNLGLKSGKMLLVEIQFQMDRLFFCRMHYAVDQLQYTSIVFPDVPKINPLRNEKHNLKIGSSVLNPDQMAAVRHIVAERTGYTPPFVLYGPFGTGKTETIAQATMVLLKETKETRILICAQSNSAADLYILKHLDPFLKKNHMSTVLRRVYYKERRVYTVSPEIKKYCLLSPDGDMFDMPTKEDIEKHRVVIATVTTSLYLSSLLLQGCFTHIFIDEAAQTLECEALMPLSLATDRTCIILAGDHQQISPKVYSEEAQNQSFHQSLLERLYHYYDSHSNLIDSLSPLNILLSINYRTKMEILRFISALFYGGPDVLKSEANIRSVVGITPLVFYAVQGHEVQDENSISYYNMSEVQEIVERVDDLFDKWPQEWGNKSAKEIGVVTPYYDQVFAIRKALKRRNVALKDVMVERVQGVQGKEFRAMFITTVRTRHLIDAPHVKRQGLTECDGDIGDFGFLSDSKLLNTALTRAQSLVVVVGDPVALTAVGECVNVWRLYLKHCQNMSSLFPKNITYDLIKQQVQNLLNSPVRERLLEIANQQSHQGHRYSSRPAPSQQPAHLEEKRQQEDVTESIEQLDRIDTPPAPVVPPAVPAIKPDSQGLSVNLAISKPPPGLTINLMNGQPARSPLTPLSSLSGVRQPIPANLSWLPQQKKMESCFELGDEYSLDPEEVLQQVVKLESNNGFQGVALSIAGQKISSTNGMYYVHESSGYAVVSSTGDSTGTIEAAPVNYGSSQLEVFLSSDPNRYYRCILHITDTGCYADVITSSIGVSRLQIPSRWMCGRANDKDEVVVDVVKPGNSGQVVGVLHRAGDLNSRYIVCRCDGSSGVMIPINIGLSPMMSISTTANLAANLEGKVSVYKITKSKQVRFSHLEKVSLSQLNDKLFVVRYLRWNSRLRLPMCLIVGVVPALTEIVTGVQTLDLEYGVGKNFSPEVTDAAKHVLLNMDMCQTRSMDLRDRWSFIISNQSAEDVSHAFSIDQVEDGTYLLGVHISDVASFVPQDSVIDKGCAQRGLSLCPTGNEPVSKLLPQQVASVCGLQLHEDKLAISVLMTVQPHGELTQINVQKTLINCKQKYSFQEAEEILQDPNAHQDYVKSCILVLYQISRFWRRQRLGNAALFHDGFKEQLAPFAHQLVNEIIIMTEFHVAKIIRDRNPDCTPVYVQDAPDPVALNEWRWRYAADAINSIALTKPFLKAQELETCNCGLACTHTVNFVRNNNLQKRDAIDVISRLWDSLNEALAIGDTTYIQNVIVEAENHPQLAVAFVELNAMLKPSRFVCSGDVPPESQYHYSINRSPYMCISQPVSRYIDLVSQRYLLACLDNQPAPYTGDAIRDICSHYNTATAVAHQYEHDVLSLHLSTALQSHPVQIQSVIKQLSQSSLQICFPTTPLIKPVSSSIDFSHLGVCEVIVHNSRVKLTWQERVYNCGVLRNQASVGNNEGELNPDRFIYKVPAFQWQKLLTAIREKDDLIRDEKLVLAIDTIRKQVQNPSLSGNYIEDVSSEVFKLGKIKHYADFTMQLDACQVMKVQMSSLLNQGRMVPYIQLVNLTPNYDICLQHRNQPLACFTKDVTNAQAVTGVCSDISMYRKQWAPVVEMEAADRAASSANRITIQNVAMNWREEITSGQILTADFSLPISFMKERKIKIQSEKHLQSLLDHPDYCEAYFADFVCVRYSNIDLPLEPGLSEGVALIVNNKVPNIWVGHCRIVSVSRDGVDMRFKLELLQSDVPLPMMQVKKLTCTIELLHRCEIDRNILCCLNGLDSCPPMVQDILLRRPVTAKLSYGDCNQLLKMTNGMFNAANNQQEMALSEALHQPFSVIAGFPGTGKSQLVARLAMLYTQRNLVQRGQVLICASSDNSLNIITDHLLSVGAACPKMVRVYGDDVEQVVHPSPWTVNQPASLSNIITDTVKSTYSPTSLYDLIRRPQLPWSKKIEEYEMLFSLYADDISEEQYEEYQALVEQAELTILKDAQIILCTTAVANIPKYQTVTSVLQIIIDDAHNCTEPELLIPLNSHKSLCQVVLVGDTQQLTPRVHSQVAAQLGLKEPLMASYVDSCHRLTIQYRMHEAVAEFPNHAVYGSKLPTSVVLPPQLSHLKWPGGRPAVFCHHPGVEGTVSLPAGVPREQTVNNTTQADLAVLLAAHIVQQSASSGGSVAVLSTTKAQASIVQQRLGSTALSLTVEESQGREFDYVVVTTVRTVDQSKVELQPNAAWQQNCLGSLTDVSLTTVALTRARRGIVIIGDQLLLKCNRVWSQLLADYEAGKRLLTAEQLLSIWSS